MRDFFSGFADDNISIRQSAEVVTRKAPGAASTMPRRSLSRRFRVRFNAARCPALAAFAADPCT